MVVEVWGLLVVVVIEVLVVVEVVGLVLKCLSLCSRLALCVLARLPHCEGAAVPPLHSLPQRMR